MGQDCKGMPLECFLQTTLERQVTVITSEAFVKPQARLDTRHLRKTGDYHNIGSSLEPASAHHFGYNTWGLYIII